MREANAALEATDSLQILADQVESKEIGENDSAPLDLKPGDLVEVRSAAEIMVTLDADGKLDGLPFMPEMLAFSGRRLHVSKRADNTCALGQPRRIEGTVHLEQLRCDGSAHRGCEAGCLFLWKEAWLRPVTVAADESRPTADCSSSAWHYGWGLSCAERTGAEAGQHSYVPGDGVGFGQLPGASRKIFELLRQGCARLRFGNRSFSALRQLLIYFWGKAILQAFKLWTRAPWNADRYKKTPATELNLQPGEVVRVRGMFEILRTLDRKGCNRGMEFKPEMFQFCGRKFPVILNMERRIDERSGELKGFRSPCIVLESVYCQGQRSFCQRANYHYWREIWLAGNNYVRGRTCRHLSWRNFSGHR